MALLRTFDIWVFHLWFLNGEIGEHGRPFGPLPSGAKWNANGML